MHHGRRWQRDLRRRACNRRQKLEIVDKNSAAVRTRELAGDLHGRRAVQAVAVGGMKTHRELRRHHPHVLEFQHEIPVPGMAIVLAVGNELQPQLLLHADHVADRGLLDALELGLRDRLLLRLLPRPDQCVRPDEAADMIGAIRRLGALHSDGLPGRRPTDRAVSNGITARPVSCRVLRWIEVPIIIAPRFSTRRSLSIQRNECAAR